MHEYYCLPEDIILDLLEEKTCKLMQNNKYSEVIYMSPDIYDAFIKQLNRIYLARILYPSSPEHFITMNMSCGQVNVQPLSSKYKHLLIVGTKDDLNRFEYNGVPAQFLSDTERRKIDRDFETTVLGTASDSIDDDISTIFFNSND